MLNCLWIRALLVGTECQNLLTVVNLELELISNFKTGPEITV